jgi:phosphoglycerol transferase MdoB-like AlkP superfamily enzyme
MQPSPLDQLADIHLPDSVNWWPLAPGWWALLALLVIALIILFIIRRRAQKNRYRKDAQAALNRIYADYQTTQDSAKFLHETSVLLRRVALTAHQQTFNASIKGNAWLEWLDRVNPSKKIDNTTRFTGEHGQQLITASYQKNPTIDAGAIYHLCKFWLAQHRNHHQKIPALTPTTRPAEAKHV